MMETLFQSVQMPQNVYFCPRDLKWYDKIKSHDISHDMNIGME